MGKGPAQKRLNVLFVTYGLPYPPHSGARARDFHLLRELARRHNLTCVCLLEQADSRESLRVLKELGIRIYGFPLTPVSPVVHLHALWRHLRARRPLATYSLWNEPMFRKVAELLASGQFDLVQIEHSIMLAYRDAVPESFTGRLVLDLHNIGALQYLRMRDMEGSLKDRLLFWLKHQLMQNWEPVHAARFDCVLAVSEHDARWLRARHPALAVHVIENGVDVNELSLLPASTRSSLLFVGTLGYPPNADAIRWFCDKILPLIRQTLPDTAVEIVGRAPGPGVRALAALPGVTLHENVDDLEPYYANAQVVIVPLRAGGGTRLKILEAMAYGRAVVSTHIGSEGLDVSDGNTIRLADTPLEFAAVVVHLLQDATERTALAHRARTLVEKQYAWKDIGARLLCLYDALFE